MRPLIKITMPNGVVITTYKFTEAQLLYFYDNYFNCTQRELGERLGVSAITIKNLSSRVFMNECNEPDTRNNNGTFSLGHRAKHYRPLGYEYINSRGYIMVKVDERFYRPKHRIIWEKHFGVIPKNHNVQFKDKNKLNCAIDNLYIISRADQMKEENTINKYPPEMMGICKTIKTIEKLINNG